MLKILLYGVATFLETGIGIWFFGKMFPKRERMERRHYFAEWGLYTYMFVSSCAVLNLYILPENKKIHGWLSGVIYLLLILIDFLFNFIWKEFWKGRVFFYWMIVLIIGQYWDSYISIPYIILGGVIPVLFLFIFYECSFFQAYLWNLFILVIIGTAKVVYITLSGTIRKGYFKEYFLYPRLHTYSEIVYWLLLNVLLYYILTFLSTKHILRELLIKNSKIFLLMNIIVWRIMGSAVKFGRGKIEKIDIIFSLLLVVIVMTVGLILGVKIYGKLVETEKQLLEIRNDTVESQYRELSRTYKKIKCLIHDEKHLISYITECLVNGKIDDVLDFLKDVQCTLSDQEGRTWTGIQNLDFILNVKFRVMKEADIKFFCDLDVDTIPLKETDFVIVMGNLLDNAIEASQKCEEGKRIVNLTMKNRNDFFLVKIKNSCIKKAVMKKEKFISDKGEKHGWGIASAQYIVNQYNGEMDFAYDDKTFEVKILINNVL